VRYPLESSLAPLGKIKVLDTLKYVGGLYNKFVTHYCSLQRCGIAATLYYIHLDGGKSLAAIAANHVVSILVVSFALTPTDVTGVVCSPDHSVRALEDEKADSNAITSWVLEILGLPITEGLYRKGDFCGRDFRLNRRCSGLGLVVKTGLRRFFPLRYYSYSFSYS
jgi:hypothetical protein